MPIKINKRACFDKSSKQTNKQYRITKILVGRRNDRTTPSTHIYIGIKDFIIMINAIEDQLQITNGIQNDGGNTTKVASLLYLHRTSYIFIVIITGQTSYIVNSSSSSSLSSLSSLPVISKLFLYCCTYFLTVSLYFASSFVIKLDASVFNGSLGLAYLNRWGKSFRKYLIDQTLETKFDLLHRDKPNLILRLCLDDRFCW